MQDPDCESNIIHLVQCSNCNYFNIHSARHGMRKQRPTVNKSQFSNRVERRPSYKHYTCPTTSVGAQYHVQTLHSIIQLTSAQVRVSIHQVLQLKQLERVTTLDVKIDLKMHKLAHRDFFHNICAVISKTSKIGRVLDP